MTRRQGTHLVPSGVSVRVLALLIVAAFAALPTLRADDEQEKPLPYGLTPEAFRPFRRSAPPDREFFQAPPTFRGPAPHDPAPTSGPVPLGLIAPLGGADAAPGRRIRQAVELALEEANAAGGYAQGRPYELFVRDENDVWGAAGNALVDLVTRHDVRAVIGALEDANSHVMTRLLLKLEVPMINTGGPDPTLTEHMIPWLVRMRPDDRQTSYRLAEKVFLEDGRKRVAVFRSNDRYGRTGTTELVDAARRLQHPILVEVRFAGDEADYELQLRRLRAVEPDAIVMWGRPEPTGRALAALRAAGIDAPVYGPDRLCDPAFLAAAGRAAEGVVLTYPFDPGTERASWQAFRERYLARFGEPADAQAAFAYDGTRYLLQAIREAGLDRNEIRKALFAHATYEGVAAPVRFDVNHNDVVEVVLGRVENGAFVFDHD